ncbi:MAG: DNA-binding protein WhiA [Bacilli bacterium]|nr:DNA-binding protein WhiA [Bacilli bacterium]MDD4733231.1 DNA-binding protein WhiA [Bacilli bacterium]
MSFTGIVKNEVSKLEIQEIECITELSSLFRTSSKDLKLITENASVARRCFKMIKDTYGIRAVITVRKGYNYSKNYIYIIEIKDKEELIKKDLCLDQNIPSDYIIDDEQLLRAYLRGLFLSCGSINDPKTSRYHLEFLVDDLDYANFISDKLNIYDLNSKVLKRETKYMIYVKEAEKIGDFLRILNAYQAVLYYEDIRIYRDHKNMTNRLNNCEQANVDKMIMTASKQVEEIELIIQSGGLDLLDEREQIVAEYRLKYKESSLLELSEIISIETGNKITKSGVYHRIKKISSLAKKLKK